MLGTTEDIQEEKHPFLSLELWHKKDKEIIERTKQMAAGVLIFFFFFFLKCPAFTANPTLIERREKSY